MTENEAFNLLVDLLGHKGRLKIITSEADPDRSPLTSPMNPHYFILHDVVRIEKSKDGIFKAWSEEGDWCRGEPTSLLSRLTEHERYGVGLQNPRTQN